MDVKEKLAELVKNALAAYGRKINEVLEPCEFIADFMMVNGVTVREWISVEDRLPDGEELVMIHCKNGAMFVGYCGKQYCDHERRWRIKTALNSTKLLNVGRVTHWMPLPKPPKGE